MKNKIAKKQDQLVPYLISVPGIGDSAIGYISVLEKKNLPIRIARVYWTYFTPESVIRGYHSHKKNEQLLVAAAGTIQVSTEDVFGNKKKFILKKPDQGLFLPVHCWHTMKFSHNAVLLVLASRKYEASDYIRDYGQYKKNIRRKK